MVDYGVTAEGYAQRAKMIEHMEYQSEVLQLLASHLVGVEIHLPDLPGPIDFGPPHIKWNPGQEPRRRRWFRRNKE